MSEAVYNRLREFMDKLPGGYPETPTGAEIKVWRYRELPRNSS